MFLNFMKKEEDGRETVDLSAELDRSDKKCAFLLLATRALLQCTREFALDVQELDTPAFKAGLGELAERLAAEEKLSRVEALFESRKSGISTFAQRQKDYLRDREAEFKEIIDILSRAMVAMDSDNRDYNHNILEQSKRIEDITHLDDIKRLKQALLQEVDNMRETVREKESRDVAKIESLSKQVAVLNTELQSARTESERDGLTGVLNRRTFDRFLAELVEKNTVKEQDFALLMIDIDDFKRINDSYGHPVGDSVLAAVANKCRQSIRGEDFLARYGGEEFCHHSARRLASECRQKRPADLSDHRRHALSVGGGGFRRASRPDRQHRRQHLRQGRHGGGTGQSRRQGPLRGQGLRQEPDVLGEGRPVRVGRSAPETRPACRWENFAGSPSCQAGVRVAEVFSAQFRAGCARGRGVVHGSCLCNHRMRWSPAAAEFLCLKSRGAAR